MNTSPTPPPQATPRTDAEASSGWTFDAICVGANFARTLERELTAARAQVEEMKGRAAKVSVSLLMPTQEDPFARVECESVDYGHADNVLAVKCAKVEELEKDLRIMTRDRNGVSDMNKVHRDRITDLTAEVERLNTSVAVLKGEYRGASKDRDMLLRERDESRAQLTDERTRSAKLVEALETAQRRFENAAATLSMYGVERTQESQRLAAWATDTAKTVAALTDSRSSGVEPSEPSLDQSGVFADLSPEEYKKAIEPSAVEVKREVRDAKVIAEYRIETIRHAANVIFNKLNEVHFFKGTHQGAMALLDAQACADIIVASRNSDALLAVPPATEPVQAALGVLSGELEEAAKKAEAALSGLMALIRAETTVDTWDCIDMDRAQEAVAAIRAARSASTTSKEGT